MIFCRLKRALRRASQRKRTGMPCAAFCRPKRPSGSTPTAWTIQRLYRRMAIRWTISTCRVQGREVQLDLLLDYADNVALYPAFQSYCGRTGRACWRCGAKMIRSSCQPALRRSSATLPARSCVSSTPATLRWRLKPTRLRQRFVGSSHPRRQHGDPQGLRLVFRSDEGNALLDCLAD